MHKLTIIFQLFIIAICVSKSSSQFNPSILQDSRNEPKLDGTFGFLYRTEDGISHAAKADPGGIVHGRFTYTDPTGLKVNFNYNAGSGVTPKYNYNQPIAPAPAVAAAPLYNYDQGQQQDYQRRTKPPALQQPVYQQPIQQQRVYQQPIQQQQVYQQPIQQQQLQHPLQQNFYQPELLEDDGSYNPALDNQYDDTNNNNINNNNYPQSVYQH